MTEGFHEIVKSLLLEVSGTNLDAEQSSPLSSTQLSFFSNAQQYRGDVLRFNATAVHHGNGT